MTQIVFIRAGETFHANRTTKETVEIRALSGTLPFGMFAHYTVERFGDGRERVHGVMQARAAGGRRYFFDSSVTAADARLLKWSARILRERAKEDERQRVAA